MIRLKFNLSLKMQEKVILHDFTKIVETSSYSQSASVVWRDATNTRRYDTKKHF